MGMELPELFSSVGLPTIAITAGLVAVFFLALWLVVRSAALSALKAHERRRDADAGVVGPRRGSSTDTAPGERRIVSPVAAPAPTPVLTPVLTPQPTAAVPVPSLAPPTGEARPAPPYDPREAQQRPPEPAPRHQPQQTSAAAAAAALFQSHPAVHAEPGAQPRELAPSAGPQPPPIPQDAPGAPQQTPVQPPGGRPVVMSALDPAWAPPAPGAANPFHVAGEARMPSAYETPTDQNAPRKF